MKVGNNFDYNSFAAAQPGVSTGKIAQWLGQPYGRGVELLPDGTRINGRITTASARFPADQHHLQDAAGQARSAGPCQAGLEWIFPAPR